MTQDDERPPLAVNYAPRAIDDLKAIEAHLTSVNAAAVSIVLTHISDTIQLLKQFPFIGAIGAKGSRRRLAVVRSPYMVYYKVELSRIIVMHVRHTSRRPLKS